MSTAPATNSPTPDQTDGLPLRWALIMMCGLVVGLIAGLLTHLQTGSWPPSLLTAMGFFGAAVQGMHTLLGK